MIATVNYHTNGYTEGSFGIDGNFPKIWHEPPFREAAKMVNYTATSQRGNRFDHRGISHMEARMVFFAAVAATAFCGAETMKLPPPDMDSGVTVMQALKVRRSERTFADKELYCAANGLATVCRRSMDADALKKALKLPDTTVLHLNHPVGYSVGASGTSGGSPSAKAVRNRAAMRLFEKCINTNDLELGRRLISEKAAFDTPVSPTPLHGAEGYLSVVTLMRKSFPDVQWKLVDMVADEKTVAVQWECSGTFNGDAPFAGLQPNGRKFSTTVMNFYSFDDEGMIFKDVAATGIAGILQGIGAVKQTTSRKTQPQASAERRK